MRQFYIVGCQRSGTTLMRLVLESHSRLFCFDEADSYRLLLAQPRSAIVEAVDAAGIAAVDVKAVGFKIPSSTEQLLQDELSDIDYGRCPNFYRGGAIVFMKRNVADVVASMMSLVYGDGETWITKYGRKILAHKCTSERFRERYVAEYALIERRGAPDHLLGALYWKFKTDAYRNIVSAGLPIVEISYEALVADPEGQLSRVLDLLAVCWQASLLQHHRLDHRELEADGMAIGGTDPARAIDQASVGRSRAVFDAATLADIATIAASTTEVSGT